MEWNKQKILGLLAVVCGGVAFYTVVQNLPGAGLAATDSGPLPAGRRHCLCAQRTYAGH